MLFHVGSLWRLNEAGLLGTLDRVSSVSGGSIVAGLLGLRWSELKFTPDCPVSPHFRELIVAPLRRLARRTLDLPVGLSALATFRPAGNLLASAYHRHLFGDASLQDLPEHPRFVINATNLQSGVLWRFSKPYSWDYRVGKVENPTLSLALAVAASSAFPPVLSPVVLRFREDQYAPGTGLDLQRHPFTTTVSLTDGGVYDNLGLETAVRNFETVLVSDGGGKMGAAQKVPRHWLGAALRINGVIDNQVRSLRKRQLIDAFQSGRCKGAYWSVRTRIEDYELADVLPCPFERTQALAATPTRLCRVTEVRQEQLINWGYAVCDAALRGYVDPYLSAPKSFPYEVGV